MTLSVGGTEALTVADRTGFRVRHRNFLGRLDPIGPGSSVLDRADSSFTVRKGLNDSRCVSLESVNYPGYFLRHQNFVLKLQRRDGSGLFAADATFCPVTIRSGAALALRSSNYPKRFVVASGDRLTLDESAPEAALALVPRAAD
ncbi:MULTISPECIES: AbfB domain-containing protein [unclassified Actinoplanes]|uniref:AbfB domain-containing protein n=1 Tax=unclassified Actinoplanes TaxID=2626549 RepID=UPI0012F721F7|nr:MULTISPECIES: AbfB domain-containing protein [unclassified Actinoplanes]